MTAAEYILLNLQLKELNDTEKEQCKHKNTSAYHEMGSEYSITCNDCGKTIE